jgi:hypothetical protein
MGLGMANDAFKFTRTLEFEGHGEADAWLASLTSSADGGNETSSSASVDSGSAAPRRTTVP